MSPRQKMMIERTIAKIGRSIKNLEIFMGAASYFFPDEAMTVGSPVEACMLVSFGVIGAPGK